MGRALEVQGISKSFGSNRVLRGVGFGVDKGHIYGLMGANGAGKSTLIKILSGAEQPDGGEIRIGGRNVAFADPLDAQRSGVATVHQNPNDGVVLDMTVAENLALDRLADGSFGTLYSRRNIEREARSVAEALGLRLTRSLLRSLVRELGVSDRQLLVLARALSRKPEILILDEPTSALSSQETLRLFALVRGLVADGMTVLFVTHKLAEFDQMCQHVGALRDGAMHGEFYQQGAGGFPWSEVLTVLFDRSPTDLDRQPSSPGRTVLSLRGVQIFPDSTPFDLDVHQGQVTVLLGLLGSGKTELLEWVFGAGEVTEGHRSLDNAAFEPRHPGRSVRRGVYLVPESRHEQAIIPGWPVFSQMSLPFVRHYSTATMMRGRRERKAAGQMMSGLGVVARSTASVISTLSGGNQQKVVVGRWLLGSPRILLLDEPFRGVDINARHDIGSAVRNLTKTCAVLAATSDLDEALEIGDRFVVLNQGTTVSDVTLAEVTRDELIRAMSGDTTTASAPKVDAATGKDSG